jgi:hypothetical protein
MKLHKIRGEMRTTRESYQQIKRLSLPIFPNLRPKGQGAASIVKQAGRIQTAALSDRRHKI